jgi:hypothetical protein
MDNTLPQNSPLGSVLTSAEGNVSAEAVERAVGHFFTQVAHDAKIYSESRAEVNRHTGKDFNCLSYTPYSENKVTEIIADLLKPYGTHGQGDIFLSAFTRIILQDENKKLSFEQLSIKTEARTTNIASPRRIDLLIVCRDWACAVENKAKWAIEQPNQLDDYSRHLASLGKKNSYIVFMPCKKKSPETLTCSQSPFQNLKIVPFIEDISDDPTFISFFSWLKECIRLCESEKVRFFLNDFWDWLILNIYK